MGKLFIDTSAIGEIQEALSAGILLSGVTTNPSNFVASLKKNADQGDLKNRYISTIKQIHELLPNGSISVEVYADAGTTTEEILSQADAFLSSLPYACIKLPITTSGLEAAELLVQKGVSVNMTLCFTQKQALAVHLATKDAATGTTVFISPFVGRLFDNGYHGFDLVSNIKKSYTSIESHVTILAASIRTAAQIQESFSAGADVVTARGSALIEWQQEGDTIATESPAGALEIPYEPPTNIFDWRTIDISSPLTEAGLQKFADDWNSHK